MICYNAVISDHANAGDKVGAVKYLEIAERKGFDVEIISYSYVLDAHAKARDKVGAVKYLAIAERKGLDVNLICYNAVISAHANAGDKVGAVKYLEIAERKSFDVDIISYNSVIDAHAKGQRGLIHARRQNLTKSALSDNHNDASRTLPRRSCQGTLDHAATLVRP